MNVTDSGRTTAADKPTDDDDVVGEGVPLGVGATTGEGGADADEEECGFADVGGTPLLQPTARRLTITATTERGSSTKL
jgi:hypothetical protein